MFLYFIKLGGLFQREWMHNFPRFINRETFVFYLPYPWRLDHLMFIWVHLPCWQNLQREGAKLVWISSKIPLTKIKDWEHMLALLSLNRVLYCLKLPYLNYTVNLCFHCSVPCQQSLKSNEITLSSVVCVYLDIYIFHGF